MCAVGLLLISLHGHSTLQHHQVRIQNSLTSSPTHLIERSSRSPHPPQLTAHHQLFVSAFMIINAIMRWTNKSWSIVAWGSVPVKGDLNQMGGICRRLGWVLGRQPWSSWYVKILVVQDHTLCTSCRQASYTVAKVTTDCYGFACCSYTVVDN